MSAGPALSDPFAYCAAVGTTDFLLGWLPDGQLGRDARYTGPAEPVSFRSQLRMEGHFTWRCDRGKVLACSYGANLQCGGADINRVPTSAEAQFCVENPNAPGIPMYITGHSTIYTWACQGGRPVIIGQGLHTDEHGFIKELWYEIRRP